MRRQQISGAFLLIAASCCVQAEGLYIGASAGLMDADFDGFDDATNAGVLIGYDIFTKEIFSVSLEGELTTTVSDGDVDYGAATGDWDIDTQAAYLAARLGDRFYMKVRYGVARADISVDISGSSINDTDTNGSWGGALGWMFNKNWGVQVDGTMIDVTDIAYWNAGIRYQFQ